MMFTTSTAAGFHQQKQQLLSDLNEDFLRSEDGSLDHQQLMPLLSPTESSALNSAEVPYSRRADLFI